MDDDRFFWQHCSGKMQAIFISFYVFGFVWAHFMLCTESIARRSWPLLCLCWSRAMEWEWEHRNQLCPATIISPRDKESEFIFLVLFAFSSIVKCTFPIQIMRCKSLNHMVTPTAQSTTVAHFVQWWETGESSLLWELLHYSDLKVLVSIWCH